MRAPQQWLPELYLDAFAAPAADGEGAPSVWAYRAWIGEWKRAPVRRPAGGAPHFNDVEDDALERLRALDGALEELAPALGPLLPALAERRALSAVERGALVTLAAILGVRNAASAGDLAPDEARSGVAGLAEILGRMGLVFFVAPPGTHFIGSSSPFHASVPVRDRIAVGFRLTDAGAEVTLPLGPRVAMLATWRKQGELWRSAPEDAVLEVNGRTCQGARRYLVAPEPRLPG